MPDTFDQRITFMATLTVNRRGLNWETAKKIAEQTLELASESTAGEGELELIRVTGLESIDDYEERS